MMLLVVMATMTKCYHNTSLRCYHESRHRVTTTPCYLPETKVPALPWKRGTTVGQSVEEIRVVWELGEKSRDSDAGFTVNF